MQFTVCNHCGACCRKIGCRLYQGDKCPIYDTRPTVCDVGRMAQDMETISAVPAGAFMMANVVQCRVLQQEAGLPELSEPDRHEIWEHYEQRVRG